MMGVYCVAKLLFDIKGQPPIPIHMENSHLINVCVLVCTVYKVSQFIADGAT